MINNYRMYKSLSRETFNSLHIEMNRSYHYFSDSDLKDIQEQHFPNTNNNKIFQLIDEDYEWDPKLQPVYLDLKIKINNIKSLFGINGFCYEDCIVAIGLIWKAKKSKIKRCVKIGEFDNIDDTVEFKINDIELVNLTSNIEFDLIIYVAKPGRFNGSKFFGNEKGLILYQENMWSIIIEGNGSIFPIEEINIENGPLWDYYVYSNFIEEDPFDLDHVKIILNKSHPSYEMIHPQSDTYNPYLMNEIIAFALTMIIIELRNQESSNFDDTLDYSNDSILQVLIYFRDKLGFRINDNYHDLLLSIQKYFDKEK